MSTKTSPTESAMKTALEGILLLAAIEAVHFIVLTGLLCLLGVFTRADGTAVTFRQLLWNGGVAFWFDGYGAILLLCLLVVIGWVLLDFVADRDALEKRRQDMDKEIQAAAQRFVDRLRPQLESSIMAACERELAGREDSLAHEMQLFGTRQWELSIERHDLETEKAIVRRAQEKTTAWKNELEDLRWKAKADKDRRLSLKQRVSWARDALTEDPPNVGLALRHLKNAGKL